MDAWVPGHSRTLHGAVETMTHALQHPYDDALVFALQQQLILDWKKGAQGMVSTSVIDAQFKRAVMVLDDLRLAGYDVMVKKKPN